MRKRFPTTLALTIILLPATAQAAFYEFTLRGQVTFSSVGNVNAGDAFTVRYVSDSSDLDPSPTIGQYRSSGADIVFPNATVTLAPIPGHVWVNLNTASGSDRVGYSHFNPNVHLCSIQFSFPAGTLTTDELPLTLPLSTATTATLELTHLYPSYMVSGAITSYAGTEIPEPQAVAAVVFGLPLARFVRKRSRPSGQRACTS